MSIQIYEKIRNSSGYDEMSKSQQDVHQYILNNIMNMDDITVEQIAKECFCSNTTVNRYCKRMGADGFSELKYAIVSNRDNVMPTNHKLLRNLNDRASNLNLENTNKALEMISKAEHIHIFGTGASYINAKYLQRLLTRLGLSAIATNEVSYIKMIRNIDLAIIVSNTGETFSSVQVTNDLIKRTNVLAITKANSRIEKLSTLAITHNDELDEINSISNELALSCYLIILNLVTEYNNIIVKK